MFDFSKELKAGKLTLTAKEDTVVSVYVPNKDSVLLKMPKDKVLNVTTLSAGETFMYLIQESDALSITVAGE